MPWRNWSVIVVLILANYVVFSIIGTMLFPVAPAPALTHVTRPTFTPGAPALDRVEPLSYEFLTPSPTPTATATISATKTLTPTITPTPNQ